MHRGARAISCVPAVMPLNPYAAPFVQGSGGVAAAGAEKSTSAATATPTVFCDLDGCLVDFEKGCKDLLGETPDKLQPKIMWRGLARIKGFYQNLDWMPDGRELWAGVQDLHPTILTGLPMGSWAEPQKRNWCRRELGEDVPVITCMSRDKHLYCSPGNVLIDDRLSLEADWRRAGGIFIHHTSASSSLEKLRALLPAGTSRPGAQPGGEGTSGDESDRRNYSVQPRVAGAGSGVASR